MQDVGGGTPVVVNGVEGLEAMEVSTEEAAERFRSAIGGFRASALGLGSVAEELVSKLGLDDLADVLDSIPPGLDELLALAEVLALVQPSGADGAVAAGGAAGEAEGLSATAKGFDRIVLDTAPTGHTLRLLAFPVFLDNLLTKLISLRTRLQGAVALLGALSGVDNPAAKIDAAVEKLQRWQARVANLQSLLTDPEVTDFVVVAIPSRLSVAESARLLSSLVSQDVPVSQLVVNQIIAKDATAAYLGRVVKEQQRALKTIDSGSSPLSKLQLSRVPFFDLEIRGTHSYLVITPPFSTWRSEVTLYAHAHAHAHGHGHTHAHAHLQTRDCISCICAQASSRSSSSEAWPSAASTRTYGRRRSRRTVTVSSSWVVRAGWVRRPPPPPWPWRVPRQGTTRCWSALTPRTRWATL